MDSALERKRRGGDILEGHAGAVKDDDLLGVEPARMGTGHDVTQLRSDRRRVKASSRERMVQVADGRALFEYVSDDDGVDQEFDVDLMFVRVVRANGSHERARHDVSVRQD